MNTSTPPPAAGPTPPDPGHSDAPHDHPGAPGPVPPPGPGSQVPPPPSTTTSTGADSFFDGVRRTGLVRSDERWVGGVAGGLALRLGIDPLVVRGLLAVSVLLSGIGLVLYGIGWALLPEQRDGRIHVQQLFRGDFDVAVIGAFVTFVVGVSFPDRWIPGFWWGGDGSGWPALLWLAAIVLVVVVVVRNRDGHGQGPTTWLPPTSTTPTDPSGFTSTTRGPSMTTSDTPTSSYPPPPPSAAIHPGSTPTSAPYGTGPASLPPRGPAGGFGGPVPPLPPRGPVPPPAALPRRAPSGPGATAIGVVVALSLLTLAVLMYLEREGRFDGPVLLTAGAVAVVLAGLGVVISGLRGRTSGTLGFLAVVGILAVGPALAVVQHDWVWYGSSTGVGELSHTPRTAAEAADGYSIGAGEARIDLTELESDEPVDVPISVGAGELTVVLPEGGDYEADVRIFAGEVDWLGDTVSRAGGGRALSYASESVEGGAEADLLLDITVGAGTVIVIEE